MTHASIRPATREGVTVRRAKATGDAAAGVAAPNRRPHFGTKAGELEYQLGAAAEMKLGVSALRVMLALGRKPLFMCDAAEAVDSTSANVTGLIDRLEAQGYVERRRSREDRRSIELGLTPLGEGVLNGILGEVPGDPPTPKLRRTGR
jgi:DNA-binding MarR family transcriptional regulator